MTNGDDIHNLLKTLGHDAGIYQDLAKYNASRAAVRRAAMGRPTEPVALAATAADPPPPAIPPSASEVPRVHRLGPEGQTGASSLASILTRLASPSDPVPLHSLGQGLTPTHAPTASAAPQPTRLDRLFSRLAGRPSSSLGR